MSTVSDITIESNKDAFIEAKNKAIEQALVAIGIDAMHYAFYEAPVDTGRLRNSINYATSQSSGSGVTGEGDAPNGNADEEEVAIGTNVEYAPYQEFGTSRQAGHAFLRPAIENHLSEYKETAQEYLKNAPE